MGAAERLADFISEADYLAQERRRAQKHEYFQGEVRAMAGAGLAHNQVTANLIAALMSRVRGKGCGTLGSDMRVHIPVHSFYTYPDVVVYCGKAQLLDGQFDTLLNPTLLVEVLSPGTRAYDLGEKAARYRAIDSLQHYLVIDPARPYASLLTRADRPGQWLLTETTDPTAVLALSALGCELPLAEAYEGVEWEGSAPPQ